jgi:succinyl-CoA synthetase beta subunit
VDKLYGVWEKTDATEAEINPVMVTASGDVIAADAVLNIDDDALFRQPELAELEEEYYESELERKAGNYGFDYVRLEGNIGIIGNGAGLVMATLDLVDYFGGSPANFLDIGGGAQASRVRDALDVVFSDDRVDAVLVNIFGGITRGDEVAEGINTALDSFESVPKPIVVRLAGTNAEEGLAILDTSQLSAESTLEAAVERVVGFGEEESR